MTSLFTRVKKLGEKDKRGHPGRGSLPDGIIERKASHSREESPKCRHFMELGENAK